MFPQIHTCTLTYVYIYMYMYKWNSKEKFNFDKIMKVHVGYCNTCNLHCTFNTYMKLIQCKSFLHVINLLLNVI